MSERNFFAELKRRNVYKVAVAYAVVGWLVMQVAATIVPALHLPGAVITVVVVLVLLGFPIALVVAWAFEVTPEGIKRSAEVAPGESAAPGSARKLIVTLAIVAALALGLLVFQLTRPKTAAPSAVSNASPAAVVASPVEAIPAKSIAVLPFANLSDEKQNTYFADGVQEEILTTLAKVADLKVISRTSVMQFREVEKRNLRNIAQQLGVAHVLEGSVQRAANRVRVTAQLIDARTDAHLWADRYDRDLADVFAIQTEIAQKIAGELKAALSPKEQVAIQLNPTGDTAAYDLYLRAREVARQGGSARAATEPIALLEEAIARDPAFVAALCLLAQTHMRMYWFNFDHTPARLELARKALDAAARLQPDAGEVHRARAVFHYWGSRDYNRALAELDLARRSLPNDAEVLYFIGLIERRRGRWEESFRIMEQALVLDPRNATTAGELANGYSALQRYPDARRVLDNLLAWKTDDLSVRLSRAVIDFDEKADLTAFRSVISGQVPVGTSANAVASGRGRLAVLTRDYRAAEQAHAESTQAEFPSGGFVTPRDYFEGRIARGLGDASRAEAAFLRAREHAARAVAARPDDAKALIILADIDAKLGRKEDAVRAGERAVEMLPLTRDALDGPFMLVRLAEIYAAVGETDRALNTLEQVAPVPNGPSYGELQLEESFDPLRNHPRFQTIVASLAPKDSPPAAK